MPDNAEDTAEYWKIGKNWQPILFTLVKWKSSFW